MSDPKDATLQAFLGKITHDLRGPLQTIALGAAVIEGNETLTEIERKAVDKVLLGVQRIDHMLERLAVFSEPVVVTPRKIDLVETCKAVVDETSRHEPTHVVTLDGVPRLVGRWDPECVSRCVDELIGNAIRHGRDPITISITETPETAIIAVHDAGGPIPEKHLPVLFAAPTQRGDLGGIGLCLVDLMIRAHGGTIDVSSIAGQGTTFRIRLARAAPST